jgi:AraC family transcriptional regulator
MEQLNLKTLKPQYVTLAETKLVAKCLSMSFAEDRTRELWKEFVPLIETISTRVDNDKYSVQIFPDQDFFQNFDPINNFNKYAGVKVDQYSKMPQGLDELIIPQGEYAVFDYIGKPSEAAETYRYIYYKWLPESGYALDDRPHLAIMGDKYKGECNDSEEQLLIPILKLSR